MNEMVSKFTWLQAFDVKMARWTPTNGQGSRLLAAKWFQTSITPHSQKKRFHCISFTRRSERSTQPTGRWRFNFAGFSSPEKKIPTESSVQWLTDFNVCVRVLLRMATI